jgi:hypothetical protein
LAFTSKRLLLAALLVVSCGRNNRSPVRLVRQMIVATESHDRAQLYKLLGPDTQRELVTRAARASETAGRIIAPDELLAVGFRPPRYIAREVVEISNANNRAVVQVRGEHGERDDVTCVRGADGWRVELQL